MMNTLFFVLCLVTSSIGHTVNGLNVASKEDFELERELNILNKPSVKSIYTKSGHIVDCVDIYKQPAFDNPLLKNHKLQRKPSFDKNNSETRVNISSTKSTSILEKVTCPIGTVPIRRITKDDLIRSKTLFNKHILDDKSHALAAHVFFDPSSNPSKPSYHGVTGSTSIYNPKVLSGQSSGSALFIQNEPNQIIVGWHVYPDLYRTDKTYVFSKWRSGKQTGCYNTYCSGFVQTDKSYFLGGSVIETTVGTHIIDLPISIIQDPTSKNWWLTLVDKRIGYFPANLFSNFEEGNLVGFGGFAITSRDVKSPPMGSGGFPDENLADACYFRYVSYRDASGKDIGPSYDVSARVLNTPAECYNVAYYGDHGSEVGCYLQFGGPGGFNCVTDP